MHSVVCTGLGEPPALSLADRPEPEPGPGQIRVAVGAVACSYAMGLVLAGRYQFRPEPPFVPGGEFAGKVTAVGEGVEHLVPGQRVVGMAQAGAWAEQVVVPAAAVAPVPAGLSLVDATALPSTYATAVHALVTFGAVSEGNQVVVLGAAGAVGLAAVDVATRLGAVVLAVGSTEARTTPAVERGAAVGLPGDETLTPRLREVAPGGVDVVVDLVGGAVTERALRTLGWGGRLVSVGFAAGEIPRIPLNLVLLKGVVVRGFQLEDVRSRVPDDWAAGEELLRRMVEDGLRPPAAREYPLFRVAEAVADVTDRATPGRIVVCPEALPEMECR